MTLQTILYFSSILLTCGLTGFLAWYAWRQPPLPGVRAYAALAFSECLMALTDVISMLSGAQAQALFWFNLRFLFTATIPLIFLVFALEYNGYKGWLSKKVLAGALAIPVITQVMLWSNSLHGLWVKQEVAFHQNGPFWIVETSARIPGLWYLVHSFYSQIFMLAGMVLIFLTAWRMRRQYRGQAILLIAGALVGLTASLIPTFNLIPQARFNPFIPGIGISALLYALAIFRFQFLKRSPAQESTWRGINLEAREKGFLAILILIFALFASGIAAAGYLTYRNYEKQYRAQVESQLSSIAALKVSGLENWRAERMADAEVLYNNPAFTALVQMYLENPQAVETRTQLLAWLGNYQVYNQYDRISLLDAAGAERLSVPAAPDPLDSYFTQDAIACLRSGKITFSDFHRHKSGEIHLAILVPIFTGPDNNRPLSVLVLTINPQIYLYPYIQSWPVDSASAETLLVRREGQDVLYLNELRFKQDAALTLRFPLTDTETPSVKAVLGQTGAVDGLDYRDEPVLADMRAVPDSPWFLVSKMDTAEVYGPLRTRLWQTLGMIGMAIFAAGAALVVAWRQQRLLFYRAQAGAAEKTLESEKQLQEAQTIARMGSYIFDIPSGFWKSSAVLDKVLGIDETYERSLTGWAALFHPADRQQMFDYITSEVIGKRMRFDKEYRIVRNNDQVERWVHAMGELEFDARGQPVKMRGTIQDVTESKRAEEVIRQGEEKYRRIVETANEGIIFLDGKARMTFINQQMASMLGYTIEEMLGQMFASFLAEDQLSEHHAQMKNRALGEDAVYECCFKRKDGERRWALVSAKAILDPEGKPAGSFGMLTDITERKLAEDEIRKLNAELEQRVRERTLKLETANKELEAFSYSISHDLRAPLRGIDGWSQALLEDYRDKLDEQGQQYLDRVRSETQRMGHLIEDILKLSRLTRAEMHKEPVDLSALAQAIAERLQASEPLRKVDFNIQAGLTVEGDSRLLEAALANLLENAFKFSGKRAGARIEFGRVEAQGAPAFFVRDNGTGFDMAYSQKLFGAFQRMHKLSEFPGNGIGLATVQRVIQRHGGRVWAEAQVNQGATFYFTLEPSSPTGMSPLPLGEGQGEG